MNRNTDVHAVYIVKLTLVLEIKNKKSSNWLTGWINLHLLSF